MLLATVVAAGAGLVVGASRGGRIDRLAQLPIRLPWLAGVAWLVQVALFVSPLAAVLEPWAGPIHAASIGLIGLVIVANRVVPGIALLGLGLLLNAAVYAANGGFMPTSEAALLATGNESGLEAMRGGARFQKTVLMRSDTPLWFLGDVLPVPPAGKIYSVGDLVAASGVFVLVASGMTERPSGLRRDQVPSSEGLTPRSEPR
jgi:hypothetical protein